MHLVFLTPCPEPAGGGSRFNAGLLPALRALGHVVDVRHDANDLPAGAQPVVDGLLLPDLEGRLVPHEAVAIIHHVSAKAGSSKAGQDQSAKEAVRAIEQRMLPGFRRIIATSAPVAERLQEVYGLEGVALLPPGQAELARATGSGGPGCAILSAGVLTQRKGHDRLLRALARLTDLDWTLTIAGDAQRDPAHARSIADLVVGLGLQRRVTVLPDVSSDALEAAWARADLFALVSSWEGYPAGAAEALRRGIPVVATAVGTMAATVPMTAGILSPPGEVDTLSKCLRRAIFDGTLRAALAEGAWQAGLAMPGWPEQALAFLSIIAV